MSATPQSYFEEMYSSNADPWGYETRDYERRKYSLTMAALPRPRYKRVFEPGCSIGVLTRSLADRCDELIAYERVAAAADLARLRNRDFAHVAIRREVIPDAWPEGMFDLIVLSEVTYYLDDRGVASLLERLKASLTQSGNLVSVHYRGTTDYPLSGDEAQSVVTSAPFLRRTGHYSEESFALDVLERAQP